MNENATRPPYSAVLFDVYGTLFNLTFINNACMRVTDRPADLARLWRAKQVEYALLRSILGSFVDFDRVTHDALDFALAALRLRTDDAQREGLLNAWRGMPLYPDATPALRELNAAGVPLGLLSNGSEASLRRLLDNVGAADLFSHIFSSDRAQTYKPAPAFYEMTQELYDTDPASVLMVSSNGFDIAGAKSFGFTVCRVNRNRMPADRVDLDPDFTVENFRELPAAILGTA